MRVYIVTYWDGFQDSGSETVGVCASRAVARRVMARDMRDRDTSNDYTGKLEWNVTFYDVIEELNEVDRKGKV